MIEVNGIKEASSDETIEEILARHKIDRRGIAVALNGEIVRRSEWSSTHIAEGSKLEIVTAAAGG